MGETPFGGAGKSLGATLRPQQSKSPFAEHSVGKAGAMKHKAPNSDARESRAVTQVQRPEDVKYTYNTTSHPKLITHTLKLKSISCKNYKSPVTKALIKKLCLISHSTIPKLTAFILYIH